MIALRFWLSALLLGAVAGCSVTAPSTALMTSTEPTKSELCTVYVDAWVRHFQANVAKLDGQKTASLEQQLSEARQALSDAGQDDRACPLPYCIIQPKAGGRLDSYCGYRAADPSGKELYRWVPWVPAQHKK